MATELMNSYVSVWPKMAKEGTKDVSQAVADAAAKGAEDGSGKISGVLEAASGGGLLKGFKAAAGVGVAFLGEAAVSILSDKVQEAITRGMQRLESIDVAEAKLNGLRYTAEQIADVENAAMQSVLDTQYGFAEAVDTATAAVAAGITGYDDLQRYLSLVADTASIAGTSMDGMGYIFNKVATKGKASNQELGSLAERGIPIYEWLANTLETTADDVYEMAKAGDIGMSEFLRAVEDNIGGAAKVMGNASIPAITQNIEAAMGRLGAGLMGGVYPVIKDFMLGWKAFLNSLQPGADRIGAMVGRIAQSASGIVGRLGPIFERVITALGTVTEVVVGAVEVVITAAEYLVNWIYDNFGWLIDIIIAFADAVMSTVRNLVDIVTGIFEGDWQKVWTGAYNLIVDIGEGFVGAVGSALERAVAWFASIPDRILSFFGDASEWLVEAGGNILSGLLNGLMSMWDNVVGFFTDLAAASTEAYDVELGIASPSKVFEQRGEYVMEGLLKGIVAGEPGVIGALSGFGSMMPEQLAPMQATGTTNSIIIQSMTVQADDIDEFVLSVERTLGRMERM